MERLNQLAALWAALSFILCLAAGLWILAFSGFDTDDPLATGIGLYFVGKALFVGPMLLIASTKSGNRGGRIE